MLFKSAQSPAGRCPSSRAVDSFSFWWGCSLVPAALTVGFLRHISSCASFFDYSPFSACFKLFFSSSECEASYSIRSEWDVVLLFPLLFSSLNLDHVFLLFVITSGILWDSWLFFFHCNPHHSLHLKLVLSQVMQNCLPLALCLSSCFI